MKKLAIALTAMAAFTAPALAADMARAPIRAAAPIAYAPSWTGCYISGGGGYGIFRVNHDERDAVTGVSRVVNATAGGDGWLATAGGGCDYQFNNRWVIGAFAEATA
jgi:outer membrane immunogenic protein